MLGVFGYNGYVTYYSNASSNDLDAIRKVTGDSAMTWDQYKEDRYAEMESKWNTKNIDADIMVEKYVQALRNDAKSTSKNIAAATELRKVYYHYLKRLTNDFIDDPLALDQTMEHITTAEELITKLNAKPYGYYILDNDLDFSGVNTNVTKTFMGRLDGNNHKIIGNKKPIFQKIRYGSVYNLAFENTNIPSSLGSAGILSVRSEYSVIEKINATGVVMSFGNRDNLSLICGAVSNVANNDLNVEAYTEHIATIGDIAKLNQNPAGIFELDADIDFSGYGGTGAVVTNTFTGKILGHGHTLSNLNNRVLFNNFNGSCQDLNISNFSNITTANSASIFASNMNAAKLKNMKFDSVTLQGANTVGVVAGMDKSNSTFENISVTNAHVKGSGVYVSAFIGRKYRGSIKNVLVEGTLEVTGTENGGIIGAFQEGGTVDNAVSKVDIIKPQNTYTGAANSEANGGIVGNIYNAPKLKNCISLGNMQGFTDDSGNEKLPYKLSGAAATLKTVLSNCFEYADSQGFSSIVDDTAAVLFEASDAQIHTKEFYKDTLQFDETVWNLDVVPTLGYPTLK